MSTQQSLVGQIFSHYRMLAPAAADKTTASVAVLPFTNMTADPENAFFADGITEEIINALTQIEDLHVAARTSSFSFKGKHVDLRIVGERLNVKTVLEGSAKHAAMRAIALDPQLAEAQCAQACIDILYEWQWTKSEAEFLGARELNPRYLQNLCWYAVFYLVWSHGRFAEGIAVANQAVEFDPLSGYAHGVLAFVYGHSGRGPEAARAAKSATELEESFFTYGASQHAYHAAGQFEAAIAAGEAALALSGRHPYAMCAQAASLRIGANPLLHKLFTPSSPPGPPKAMCNPPNWP
jgi:TolB-like protein